MRVIAGELKGQRLVAPRGWKVRPTSDRVREAIFSALGNVERLGLRERAELVRADAERWLAAPTGGTGEARFDLVFVDAPYRLAGRVAQSLNSHLPRLLGPGGRVIVESGSRSPLRIDSLQPLRQRRYGAADVAIYAEAGQ